MLSLTAFSQTDTSKKTKSFPIPVVKQIMKDLLSGDEAKAQLKLSDSLLTMTEKKVELKDSVIIAMQTKEINYLTLIDSQNQKYNLLENYTKKVESDLKKEKVKGKFKTIISGGVILALSILLITN